MADYARGEVLRELRAATPTDDGKRLSQEDAAHKIGVTAKTLRSWEGGGPIKWENAQKAAAFYGVEPADIATRDQAEDLGPAHAEIRRIEAKLDLLLQHFGVELEPETISEAVEKVRGRLGGEGPPPDSGERRHHDRRAA
jgi:transcriptional regulator with XRE-family HTH domain